MDLHTTIFELIDMRSFSNLWFWIALAVVWSTASHWVLGVPYDMVVRAKKNGEQAAQDLEDMGRIYSNRLLYISDMLGVSLLSITCFTLSTLGVLGFVYRVEFAQALFLLGLPMSLVGALNLSTARRIRERGASGTDLWTLMGRHRTLVQLIGMVSIFVTALWGMYQNLTVGPFGS